MRNRVVTLFAVLGVLGISAHQALGTVYTTTYANPADMPVFGTMIDPSGYYRTDGDDPKTAGNALDRNRVYMLDTDWSTFQMLKWDMNSPTNVVRVYPDVEHNGGLNWDYLQWSLWGSKTGAEDPNAWTLLWDPITSSGSNVNDFVVTSWTGTAPSVVYRYGTSLGDDRYADAFTMDFQLSDSYRYIGVRHSTLTPAWDPEINAVAAPVVPEPASLIVWSVVGGLGIAGARLRRKR